MLWILTSLQPTRITIVSTRSEAACCVYWDSLGEIQASVILCELQCSVERSARNVLELTQVNECDCRCVCEREREREQSQAQVNSAQS